MRTRSGRIVMWLAAVAGLATPGFFLFSPSTLPAQAQGDGLQVVDLTGLQYLSDLRVLTEARDAITKPEDRAAILTELQRVQDWIDANLESGQYTLPDPETLSTVEQRYDAVAYQADRVRRANQAADDVQVLADFAVLEAQIPSVALAFPETRYCALLLTNYSECMRQALPRMALEADRQLARKQYAAVMAGSLAPAARALGAWDNLTTIGDRFAYCRLHHKLSFDALTSGDIETATDEFETSRAATLSFMKDHGDDPRFRGVAADYLKLLDWVEKRVRLPFGQAVADRTAISITQLEAAEARLASWETFTAPKEWSNAVTIYSKQAALAEEAEDVVGAKLYYGKVRDAAEQALAAHPGSRFEADLNLQLIHARERLDGLDSALTVLDASMDTIWGRLPSHGDRDAFVEGLWQFSVDARGTGDVEKMKGYALAVRGAALSLIAEAPESVSQASAVSRYFGLVRNLNPKVIPPCLEPIQSTAAKSLDATDEAAVLAEQRAALDAFETEIDAIPGGVTEFIGRYILGYYEEKVFDNREAALPQYKRSLDILRAGTIDSVMAQPELPRHDRAILWLYTGHVNYANGFKDEARAIYEGLGNEFPEKQALLADADYMLMRIHHGTPSSTFDARVAKSQEFIEKYPGRTEAWELADQREREYASLFKPLRAAPLWMSLARNHPDAIPAVNAFARALAIQVRRGDIAGAEAARDAFLDGAIDPERIAGAQFEFASVVLIQEDPDSAVSLYEHVSQEYAGTAYAALAAEALANVRQQVK